MSMLFFLKNIVCKRELIDDSREVSVTSEDSENSAKEEAMLRSNECALFFLPFLALSGMRN